MMNMRKKYQEARDVMYSLKLSSRKYTCLYNGVPIVDRLQFFTGDKPAAQFKQGTQIGGTYKCGGCGCKDILMDDEAHVLRCPLRNLEELQQIAIAGTFGKQPLKLKPFDHLRVADLKKELLAHSFYEVDEQKPILTQIL